MKKFSLLFLFVMAVWGSAKGVEYLSSEDTTATGSNRLSTRQKLVIGGVAAQQVGTFLLEYKWWWKGDYHPFVMNSDGGLNNYSLGMDKAGHFYTSYMYSNLLYELLKWGDISEKKCVLYSTLLPFAWALSIEIGDGFSTYEFSPQDLLANSLGIAYAFAQRKVPYLENFKFKFSYFPSSYFMDRQFKNWSLTDDYNGHIYWLSMDIKGALPNTAKPFWPKYLNLSLGYGVNGFTESDHKLPGFELQREFFIGLDYNLKRIPFKNRSWQTTRNMVDYYHFPAPGFKKTNSGSWQLQPLLLN